MNAEFDGFEGSTADMLRYCFRIWWERVGNTKASGITKLMLSEARNFPEIAAFYQSEVVDPGHELIGRILRRGIESGEFKPVDVNYAVYSVLAPLIFLTMWKHSLGVCVNANFAMDPEKYLDVQVENLLGGLVSNKNDKGSSRS